MTLPTPQPRDRYWYSSHSTPERMISHIQQWQRGSAWSGAQADIDYLGHSFNFDNEIEDNVSKLTAIATHPEHGPHYFFTTSLVAVDITPDQASELLALYFQRIHSLVVSDRRLRRRSDELEEEVRRIFPTHYDKERGGWHYDTYNYLQNKYGVRLEYQRVRNATLSSLTASTVPPTQDGPTYPVDLDPAFDPNVYTYSVALPHNAHGATLGYETDPSDMAVTVEVDGAAQVVKTMSIDGLESREYRVNIEWDPAPPE